MTVKFLRGQFDETACQFDVARGHVAWVYKARKG